MLDKNEALSFLASRQYFLNILQSIKRDNRYILPSTFDAEMTGFFNSLKNVGTTLPEGTNLFRSRLHPFHFAEDQTFSKMEMLAPPSEYASQGRLNPVGIPYLYAAFDAKTAIAEQRPWVGATMTVATLTTKRNLKVIDLTSPIQTNEIDKNHKLWFQLMGESFARPVHTGDPVSYTPTQYLSEKIKSYGLEGIIYQSALQHGGSNIALFEDCSVEVTELIMVAVTKISIEHKEDIPFSELFKIIRDFTDKE